MDDVAGDVTNGSHGHEFIPTSLSLEIESPGRMKCYVDFYPYKTCIL